MELTKWTRPANYFGEEWPEYFITFAQTRDSSCLDQSNFRSFLKAIGGESDTVRVIRENHWACGWIEWIGIDESDTLALETAQRIIDQYNDYPVVDEDDWSNLEYETAQEYWQNMGLRERIEWCQRYDCSIFAARRNYVPDDPTGELISRLAG